MCVCACVYQVHQNEIHRKCSTKQEPPTPGRAYIHLPYHIQTHVSVRARECVRLCVCACMHSEQTRSHRHQGASARQHAPQTCCKPQACCTPPPAPLDAHSGTIRARAPPGRRVARCAAPQTLLPRGLTRTCVRVLGLWRVCVQAHEQACLHLNTHK